jgi:DNA-binding MarR family transcriptional regulator
MCARLEHELAAAGHELTFSQYVTLRMLSIGPAGVTDLARFVELNPGAMTRLLDKLEARGFIARVADPVDRRALNIHLTDAGLSMWQDINQCGQRVLERAMTGMSQAERNQLTRLLEQVRDNLSSTGS